MPVDLNKLTDGWLQLESDPGLFTLLLEDFGVKGVQVEEIYDLQKTIEGPVYGFIFLFKWIEERRSRRKVVVTDESFVQDESIVNSIFFAHQIVPNSCATHALLSVLLNCEKIYLGETLTRLKDYTKNMGPENKGFAIGNTPELARAHNSHAKPEPRRKQEKPHGISTSRTADAFHFVSYVPINGHLFELDGLKPFPIDHGPCQENEDWTEKFRRVITERLGIATGGEPYHDIRFNLMAVVPDRRIAYEQKLRTLKINRQIVLEALQQLVKVTNPQLTCSERLENKVEKANMLRDRKTAMNAATVSDLDAGVSTSTTLQAQTSGANNTSSNCSTPTKTRGTPSRSTSSPSSYVPPHPALDSHNYAKSPLMEGQMMEDSESRPRYEQYSGSEYSSDEEEDDAETGSSSPPTTENLPPPRLIHAGPGSGCPLAPNTTSPIPLRPIHVNTKDFSKPLSIQTKFETSPTPSCSSTDTSSEVGSAFNSPVRSIYFSSAQNSPNFSSLKDFKRFVVIRVSGHKDSGCEESPDAAVAVPTKKEQCVQPMTSAWVAPIPPHDRVQNDEPVSVSTLGSLTTKRSTTEMGNEAIAAASKRAKTEHLQPSPRQEVSSSTSDVAISATISGKGNAIDTTLAGNVATSSTSYSVSPRCKESPKYPQLIEPHRFAPKDLLALLKNIENEISVCESSLKDEIEKQKKYKIDDCRRTHNYDQFICTFLSMLERHGKLSELVEQHMIIKRRQGINVGRLHKVKKVDRKRKTRTRRRK